MWHSWERIEKYTRFGRESPKERDHPEDRGVDGRMGSEWTYGDWLEGVEWIQRAQDRNLWRASVNAVMNVQVLVAELVNVRNITRKTIRTLKKWTSER
jgi:hypothetical protein